MSFRSLGLLCLALWVGVAPVLAQEEPLDIVTFDVTPLEIRTGDTVTVTWEVANVDEVCLVVDPYFSDGFGRAMCSSGMAVETDQIVPAQGSMTFTATNDNAPYYEVILGQVNSHYFGQSDADAHVQVDVIEQICEFEWMPPLQLYVEYLAQQEQRFACPDGPMETVEASYQAFGEGYMLWVEDKIFAVDALGSSFSWYRDDWNGEPLDVPITAPEGFLIPTRGFGQVWYNHYSIRNWDNPNFATHPEFSYQARIQGYTAYGGNRGGRIVQENGSFAVTMPDERVLYMRQSFASMGSYYEMDVLVPVPALAPAAAHTVPATSTPDLPPTTPTPYQTVCADSPPARLDVGKTARVTVSPPDQPRQDVRVRDVAGGERLGSLAEGTIFNVIGGPVCANGLTWWQVETLDGDLTGWSAEGIVPDDYFIEPYANQAASDAPTVSAPPSATPTGAAPAQPTPDDSASEIACPVVSYAHENANGRSAFANGFDYGRQAWFANQVFTVGGEGTYAATAFEDILNPDTYDFSFSVRVRGDQRNNSTNVIFDKRYERETVQGYVLFTYGGRLAIQLADGLSVNKPYSAAWMNYISDVNIIDDQWHVVTVTIDRDNPEGGRFYVDGEHVYTFNPTRHDASLTTDSPLYLGRRSDSNSGFFYGQIAAPIFFPCALSPEVARAQTGDPLARSD